MFRWIALTIFSATLAISSWHRRRARLSTGTIPRRSEPTPLVLGRLLVALPLFGGVLLYLVAPSAMAWSSIPMAPWLRWTGVVLGALTVPAAHWVLRTLGPNVSETIFTKGEHRLVREGPYRWVRHPLYAVGIALFVGVGLLAANAFILVCAAAALLGVRLVIIPREEEQLIAKFGDEYRRYRSGTGALLPVRLLPGGEE